MVDADNQDTPKTQNPLVMVLGATTLAFFIATMVLAVQKNNLQNENDAVVGTSTTRGVGATTHISASAVESNVPDNMFFDIETIFQQGENTCADTNPKFENVDCVHLPGPQAGANVTKGYVGGLEGEYCIMLYCNLLYVYYIVLHIHIYIHIHFCVYLCIMLYNHYCSY